MGVGTGAVKLLLVEDDQPTRAALINALATQQYTVDSAADGQTGLALAKEFEYDLVLLDVGLPNLDGISLCQRLRTEGYLSPILLLTAKDSSNDRVLGLDAGADDYVTKPFDLAELLARIRALLRRGKAVTTSVITWENLQFDSVNGEVTCGQNLLHLTPKEYCLLELFLLNPKRIFSRRAILDRLWDFADSPGEETVSTHIKCLRQKVKAAGAADPIETVHGLGYRLRAPTPPPDISAASRQSALQEGDRQKVAKTTAKVWQKSKDRFLAQITVLQQASDALTTNQLASELRQQAKHEAHKLAGSLGIFGLATGSQLAKELENWFQLQTKLDEAQARSIAVLVNRLRQEIEQKPTTEVATTQAVSYSPLLLIVDDDLMLAEQIRVEAIAWGLRVEVATDLHVARSMVQASPDVILLDLNFPGTENGFTLLRELMQRIPKIPVLAFTGQGSLRDRLEVVRLGGCVFLQKPLPIQEILKAITDVLSQNQTSHHNRVLVVDDDAMVTDQLTALLQPFGIEVTPLNEPQHFWEVLTTTMPNLLLLDLEMPGFDGVELCQTVRSDPKWRNLPVLFLSAHIEAGDIDRAFVVGADDYISKAMPQAELAIRIIHRLRRGGFQGNV
jgi:DNA-binding response OmpR family regulator